MGFIDNLSENLRRTFYSSAEARQETGQKRKLSSTTPEVLLQDPDVILSDVTYNQFLGMQSEFIITQRNLLIRQWRKSTFLPEVDEAIQELINEILVFEEDDSLPIEINMDNWDIPDKIKETITESFAKILRLLDFRNEGSELFRQWYIDGILNLEVIFDNAKLKSGIQKIKLMSPFDFFKVKNINTNEIEYFYNTKLNTDAYKKQNFSLQSLGDDVDKHIKYKPEQITQVTSGITSIDKLFSISPLNKAMKTINQVSLIEDSLLIYRITRAPDKKAFYIDTGRLPKGKAEQYLKQMMQKHRNKLEYNRDTGTLENNKKTISAQEDFWLTRCISLDTKIPLMDGRDLPLKDIIKEFDEGKKLWTYSVSPTGKIVPGLISNALVTRKNTNVVKVTLDNGEEVVCTPDHKFILRDGTKIEAQKLKENDSLMSFSGSINHKVKSVEFLEDRIDTGTLTIDREHIHHNYHNFAITAGIFIMNSTDGRGTQIETIQGSGQELRDIADLDYFYNKMWRALQVPANRRNKEESRMQGLTSSNFDIEREEIKFFKHIIQLRKKFNEMFRDLLKKELISSKVVELKDWKEWKENIRFVYKNNSEFAEMKKLQVFESRMNIAGLTADLLEHKIISKEWIKREVMNQNEEEIKQIQKEIDDEKESEPDEDGEESGGKRPFDR